MNPTPRELEKLLEEVHLALALATLEDLCVNDDRKDKLEELEDSYWQLSENCLENVRSFLEEELELNPEEAWNLGEQALKEQAALRDLDHLLLEEEEEIA